MQIVLLSIVIGNATVEPIVCRQILDPRMFDTNVIIHMVENHFQTQLVGFLNEILVLLVGTKSRIYAVQIGGRVSVVAGPSTVFENWVEPNGRDPELFEVIKSLGNALQIPAVAFSIIGRIEVVQTISSIIFLIAVSEAIGRDQVDDISIGKSGVSIGSRVSFQDRKRKLDLASFILDTYRVRVGRQCFWNSYVDEGVMAVFRGSDLFDYQLLLRAGERGVDKIIAG